MQTIKLIILLILTSCTLLAQPENLTISTSGNYSPSVYAKETAVAYGLHPRIVDELLLMFEQGANSENKKEVEALLDRYQALPQGEKADQELSASALAELGIDAGSDLEKIMQWAVFTEGDESPAVFALGNVDIWYGISPKAFRGLYETFFEKQGQSLIQQGQINDFERQLEEQIQRYKQLRSKLALREDEMAQEANFLLDEGRIEEAIKVLENRYYFLKRKRERAEEQERQAEQALDESIEQIKLKIEEEEQMNGNNSVGLIVWYEKLGDAAMEKENYTAAAAHFEKCLIILRENDEVISDRKPILEEKLKKVVELKEKKRD